MEIVNSGAAGAKKNLINFTCRNKARTKVVTRRLHFQLWPHNWIIFHFSQWIFNPCNYSRGRMSPVMSGLEWKEVRRWKDNHGWKVNNNFFYEAFFVLSWSFSSWRKSPILHRQSSPLRRPHFQGFEHYLINNSNMTLHAQEKALFASLNVSCSLGSCWK